MLNTFSLFSEICRAYFNGGSACVLGGGGGRGVDKLIASVSC